VSIGIFRKPYTVRKYGKQEIVNGYPRAPYTDVKLRLDVQPLSADDLQALPEGQRTVKRVKAYGKNKLTAADEYDGIPGDRLFYQGLWYACTSSVMWEHTALAHYRSEFTLQPPGEQEGAPFDASQAEPEPEPEPEEVEP